MGYACKLGNGGGEVKWDTLYSRVPPASVGTETIPVDVFNYNALAIYSFDNYDNGYYFSTYVFRNPDTKLWPHRSSDNTQTMFIFSLIITGTRNISISSDERSITFKTDFATSAYYKFAVPFKIKGTKSVLYSGYDGILTEPV